METSFPSDDEDEKWRSTNGTSALLWRFMHSSTYQTAKKGDNGMTWVIMLRQVQKKACVMVADNTFEDKSQEKEADFAKHRNKCKKAKGCEAKVKAITEKLDALCKKKIN